MRRTVRELSEPDLLELADQWGIDVNEAEVSELLPRVSRRLEGLDEVYELPRPGLEHAGDRSWHEPSKEEDPYNALVTCCEIPPSGEGPLTGVRLSIKDVIAVAGVPMQCGSAVMEGFVPNEDATVVTRLRDAGAEITSKSNLDEFAGGGRGVAYDGRIRHPADADRYPGGSSGGSAAAVLGNLADIALGTDTGGSVRAPAALCGLVGVKPTYGRIPLTGVVENTYTLDHVGIISRTVEEARVCLDVIAGKDERDPASMAAAGHDDYEPEDFSVGGRSPFDVDTLTLGRLVEAFDGGETAVADHIDDVIDELSDAGADVVDVSIPEFDLVDTIKNCLTYPEIAHYWHAGSLPIRRGGGESRDQLGFARRAKTATGELNLFYRGRMLAGAHLLTAHDGRHYSRALAACRELRDRVARRMDDAGVSSLVSPTVPGVAPKHEDADDLEFGITRNTRIANVTEQPAITVPCGTVDGLPVGLHLLGYRFADADLLRVAAGVESAI